MKPKLEKLTTKLYTEHIDGIIVAVNDYYNRLEQKGQTPEKIVELMLRLIQHGLVYIAFDGAKTTAFLVMEVLDMDGVIVLNVTCSYVTGANDLYLEGWPHVLDAARIWNCKRICCKTQVGRRWLAYYRRKLKRLGFKPEAIIYSMEVV